MDNPAFLQETDPSASGESVKDLLQGTSSSNPFVVYSDNNCAHNCDTVGECDVGTTMNCNSVFGLQKPIRTSSFNFPNTGETSCKYKRVSGSVSLKRTRAVMDGFSDKDKPNNTDILNNEHIYCSISDLKSNNEGKCILDVQSLNSSLVTNMPCMNIKHNNISICCNKNNYKNSLFRESNCFDEYGVINCNDQSSSEDSSSNVHKINQIAAEDNIISSLSYFPKCNNCVDTITAKNTRNLRQDYPSPCDGISTVSSNVPMYHGGLYAQSSPRPCAQNRTNLRRSSKMLTIADGPGGITNARLKRQAVGRGWKLQFIQSENSHRKSLALCCLLLLACVLVITATALVVYVATVMDALSQTTVAPRHQHSGANLISGQFEIMNEVYQPSLYNTSSPEFIQLTSQISQLLDLLFRRSTVSTLYNHSEVMQLSPASPQGVTVTCEVGLITPRQSAANLIGLEFLRGLQHRHGHMWLGDFMVNIQSISFVELLEDDTPVVSNNTPSPALQPGWSSWSAWSHCNASGVTLGSSHIQSRTRLCRLDRGTGVPLTSIEPCLLLESPGGDLEVRDCQHTELLQDRADTVMSATMFEDDRFHSSINSVRSPVNKINSTASSKPIRLNTNRTSTYVASILLHPSADVSKPPLATNTIPVMDLSLSLRHCDECIDGEVCVALSKEQVPVCRQPIDHGDPTGCGGHCLINTELCQKLDVDAFRCVDDSYCLPTEWRCANQLCIPQGKRCDGHMNCYDRTDEQDCDCDIQSNFHCGNNTSCLPNKKRCDGVIDCWDGTDELNCTMACPSTMQFTCTNGQCIPRVHFCDSYADCTDGSDEPLGCSGECKNHEWKCENGRCIKKQMVCDGNNTCGDQSDEKNCPVHRRERNYNYRSATNKSYV